MQWEGSSVTVREIARLAGVSPATVSRYFTGAEFVSDGAAAKISEVIARSGRQEPHRVRRRSGLLALAVPHMRLAFYTEVMKLFMEKVSGYGMQLLFFPICGMDAAQSRAWLGRMKPDGLILLEETDGVPLLEIAKEMEIPVVVCGEALPSAKQATTVHVNDIAAAYEGTRYLLGLGHRNIVFFSNDARGINASYQRIRGCSMAMQESGLSFGEPYVRYGELTYENGYRFAHEIVTGGLQFSAIFAFSDEMARGAINALLDLNVRIPQDVSVLGFDDLPLAEQTRPRLTTIHQPLDEFVQQAVDIFFNDPSAMRTREIVLPHSIVERDSCSQKGAEDTGK